MLDGRTTDDVVCRAPLGLYVDPLNPKGVLVDHAVEAVVGELERVGSVCLRSWSVRYPVNGTRGPVQPRRSSAGARGRRCHRLEAAVAPSEDTHRLSEVVPPRDLAGAKEWSSGLSGSGEKAGPVCPNCFVTVPFGTGICDTCGTLVD